MKGLGSASRRPGKNLLTERFPGDKKDQILNETPYHDTRRPEGGKFGSQSGAKILLPHQCAGPGVPNPGFSFGLSAGLPARRPEPELKGSQKHCPSDPYGARTPPVCAPGARRWEIPFRIKNHRIGIQCDCGNGRNAGMPPLPAATCCGDGGDGASRYFVRAPGYFPG